MTTDGRRALVGAGVLAGVAGAAYAAERAIVAGVRRAPDPDAGKPLQPPYDETFRFPTNEEVLASIRATHPA